MKVVHIDPESSYEFPIVAIGNFDGVHRGHQELIRRILAKADEWDERASVLTFSPHPMKVLCPARAPRLLMSNAEKASFLGRMGVDAMLVYPFTVGFAKMAPRAFAAEVLERLGVRYAVVGYNFSFGSNGSGTPAMLSELGHEYGFEVDVVPEQRFGNVSISSTEIRKALAFGDVDKAVALMGHSDADVRLLPPGSFEAMHETDLTTC